MSRWLSAAPPPEPLHVSFLAARSISRSAAVPVRLFWPFFRHFQQIISMPREIVGSTSGIIASTVLHPWRRPTRQEFVEDRPKPFQAQRH